MAAQLTLSPCPPLPAPPSPQDQVGKLREERDKAVQDVAVLRADLDSTRQERDRLLADNTRVKEDYERIRTLGGNSIERLETLSNDKATLEVQLSTQVRRGEGRW